MMGWAIGLLILMVVVFLALWILALNWANSLRSHLIDAHLSEAMYSKMNNEHSERNGQLITQRNDLFKKNAELSEQLKRAEQSRDLAEQKLETIHGLAAPGAIGIVAPAQVNIGRWDSDKPAS